MKIKRHILPIFLTLIFVLITSLFIQVKQVASDYSEIERNVLLDFNTGDSQHVASLFAECRHLTLDGNTIQITKPEVADVDEGKSVYIGLETNSMTTAECFKSLDAELQQDELNLHHLRLMSLEMQSLMEEIEVPWLLTKFVQLMMEEETEKNLHK